MIDGGLTYLDTLSVRFDRERSRRIQAIYREAQDHLRRRIQAHERL